MRRRITRSALSDVLYVLAAAILAAGVGLVYLPAGVIVLGITVLIAAWAIAS